MKPDAAALARHPHLATTLPPGRVRVDCHLHTMWSGDATTTPDELATAIVSAGLDVVCVTDHGSVAGAQRLANSLPCRVVVGQEQMTASGEIIGLFLSEHLPRLPTALDVAREIRAQGGLVYVPHPFDPLRHNLNAAALDELVCEGLVDVIEVRNAKTSLEHLNHQGAEFAAKHELAAGAGSDAHVPQALGAAYVEMADFTDAESFLNALGDARAVGHHFDPPRQWSSRIVPSTSRLARNT